MTPGASPLRGEDPTIAPPPPVPKKRNSQKGTLKKKLQSFLDLPPIDLQEEVSPFLRHLDGVVLNAGAGHRPVETGHPTLCCDFDETAPVDFLADLHFLPLKDACVDSVLSVAVLEHTRTPWECAKELLRVLKPGGAAVICVPFLQPEHAVPHDFFRFTAYGLRSMLEWAGFEVQSVERLGRQARAVAWLLRESWRERRRASRTLLLPLAHLIARGARTGDFPPASVYTGSYAIARKPGVRAARGTLDLSRPDWFVPWLVDPVSKKALRQVAEGVENDRGHVYRFHGSALDLRPPGGLSQDATERWR